VVERLSALLMKARLRLRELRIANVRLKHADGHFGLKEAGPFDAIVMAADPPRGRLVADFLWSQEPYRVRRRAKIPVYLVLAE